MPELPEVETVRRVLEPQLTGRCIVRAVPLHADIVAHPSQEKFVAAVQDARIASLSRRGKFLMIDLEGGAKIVLHLRMTGQFLRTPADFPHQKHTHMILQLDDTSELRFIDLRRFGRFWYLAPGESDSVTGMDRLGPEPFDPRITGEYLRARLSKSRRAIKDCLLDQTVVAGIGNIYSDEALFAANIHPSRPACSLTDAEWEDLAAKIPVIIQTAIDGNAISAEDYLAGMGRDYRNTPLFKVYGRGGEPCKRCLTILETVRIAGRTSCFCPFCQM